MSVTKSYNRPKATLVNNTGIVLTVYATEKPITNPTVNGTLTAGNTGEVNIEIDADADDSVATNILPLFRATITPSLNSAGILTFTITPYAIDGTPDETPGTAHLLSSLTYEHPEDMDTWQAAAGRPRQA